MFDRARAFVRVHDPEHDALRRAARAAIVIPLAFAFAKYVIGGAQAPLFAVFGSFALLVFVDFPGDRRARASAYLGLATVGAVLITLGTLASRTAWLAVALMLLVGVVVLFAGVLSTALAAASRATLLTFVLPVATPAPPGAVPERLLGWCVALVWCVPAALFVFPPQHHDRFRHRAARVCRMLADLLDADCDRAQARAAMAQLRNSFLASATRPVGLSAGSRALTRVVSELQWLTDRLTLGITSSGSSPAVAAQVLRSAATVLHPAPNQPRQLARAELDAAIVELEATRDLRFDDFAATKMTPAELRRAATSVLAAHAADSAVAITGRIIAWAAAADARPVLDRLLGRGLRSAAADGRAIPAALTSPRYTRGYLRARSISLQNSVRGGLGLAIAVGITEFFPVEHGFWIVLGTLSVLRSTALSTGSTVLRAVLGTVVGFTAGAGIIELVGTGPVLLWILLPPAIFLSAFVPEVVSFAAGQAAFTMTVLILFNLISPAGFGVGLVRIEDVVLGSVVAVVVAVLAWPRSAAATARIAARDAAITIARFLDASVQRVTRHEPVPATVERKAFADARTFDDVVRQYLSERGGDPATLQPTIQASNRSVRVLLAAEAIGRIELTSTPSTETGARAVLEQHTAALVDWLDRATPNASAASKAGTTAEAPVSAPVGEELVDAVGTDADRSALDLLWTAAYLNELELLRDRQSAAEAKLAAEKQASRSP